MICKVVVVQCSRGRVAVSEGGCMGEGAEEGRASSGELKPITSPMG